jgi:hypothetical protein
VEAPALFIRDGDAYVATILTQGGWDPANANGGAVLALLGQYFDSVPTLVPMTISRFTADLVRPVRIGAPMQLTHEVVREGKKIQVVELRLRTGGDDGVDHARITVLRLRDEDLSGHDAVPASTTDERPADALARPEELRSLRDQSGGTGAGMLQAVDMRRVRRHDRDTGVYWWLRLDTDVVAGEPVTPTARMTFAFDFANLIGIEPKIGSVTLINPDVTAHVLRAPRGEWVAVTGDTRFEAAIGRGVSIATLSDLDGPFAVATTSQLIQPRR